MYFIAFTWMRIPRGFSIIAKVTNFINIVINSCTTSRNRC